MNKQKVTRRKKVKSFPSIEQLEKELRRERYRHRYSSTMRSTVYILITVAAAAVLVATLWMPVLQIYGTSMKPTLEEGEIVISVKSPKIERGDIIGFYYNNKLLVKRVIALPGDTVDIDEDGNVFVNGEQLTEPYITEKALGDCDISLPYQVPNERYFIMGDHRSLSLDSRNSAIGCVSKDQIAGNLVFSVWPISSFGKINP